MADRVMERIKRKDEGEESRLPKLRSLIQYFEGKTSL